eukprot:TRINITY_DN8700_c0_g1_i1.p1 TRINITY_DN8700_c0_g1~~TRINITY_DN8700_c0_g1_i1.p1  ORF type:complete len:775 (+),score=178.79 TRINITY_DN8700_c0_g1_i1:1106-3430(+)
MDEKIDDHKDDLKDELIKEDSREKDEFIREKINPKDDIELQDLSDINHHFYEEDFSDSDDSDSGEDVNIKACSSCFQPPEEKKKVIKRKAFGELIEKSVNKNQDEFIYSLAKPKQRKNYHCLCIKGCFKILCFPCSKMPYKLITIFLIILGLIISILGLGMDVGVTKMRDTEVKINTDLRNKGIHVVVRLILWFVWTFLFIGVGGALIEFLSHQSVGSGVPWVKTIISGSHVPGALTIRTWISKITSLFAIMCGGVFIGKKGPFIHISMMTSHLLLKLPLFNVLRSDQVLKRQMYIASIAGGIGSIFGAPIGGILFTVEATSTLYRVQNYWYSLLAAVPGAMLFRLLWHYYSDKQFLLDPIMLLPAETIKNGFHIGQMLIYILMGIIFGFIGPIFIFIVGWMTKMSRLRVHRWAGLGILAFVTAIITFPDFWGDFAALSTLDAAAALFSTENLDWTTFGSAKAALVIYFFTRLIGTLLALSAWIPSGSFVPTLVLGATGGRFLGEFLKHSKYILNPNPALFAIVGASSFATSVHHIITTSVLIIEWSGANQYLIPALVSSLISLGISKRIMKFSIWDRQLVENGLPFLPDIDFTQIKYNAGDIMDKHTCYLVPEPTLEEASDVLKNTDFTSFPVIESVETKRLIGRVTWYDLQEYFISKYKYSVVQKMKLSEDMHLFAMTIDIHRVPSTPRALFNNEINLDDLESSEKRLEISFQPPKLKIQSVPHIRISGHTPLQQIHSLFETLSVKSLFVTEGGALIGVISRDRLSTILLRG